MTQDTGPAQHADRPLLGIALMLMAMLMFMITDTIAKYLTDEIHPIEIVWSRYMSYLPVLVPLAIWRGIPKTFATPGLRVHIGRSVFMLASSIVFTLALSHLDLAFAVTVAFVSPLFVTALSMLFLGERVGARRWAAVVVGFLGVLIVIRPGLDFSPWSLLPILSAFTWAISLILTRKTGSDPPLTTLVYTTLIGLAGSSVLVIPVWTWPSLEAWVLMFVSAAWNLVGLTVMFRAFAYAPASTLAPYSYSSMLWSTIGGYLVFHQIPDLWTYVGGAIVVASGVYIWHRERVRARSQPA
jgi:drug/metabolite transporter (DMT)-like permease